MSHESKPNYFKKKSCKNFKLNQLRPKMTNKVHFDLWNNILFWQNNISLLYVTMSKLCGSRMDENTVFQIEQLLDKNYNWTCKSYQDFWIFSNWRRFFDFRRFVPPPTFVTLLLDQIGWTKYTYYNRMYNRCDLYWGQA